LDFDARSSAAYGSAHKLPAAAQRRILLLLDEATRLRMKPELQAYVDKWEAVQFSGLEDKWIGLDELLEIFNGKIKQLVGISNTDEIWDWAAWYFAKSQAQKRNLFGEANAI